jgi:gamma-glutamyltranspeptidase/glutathione hydrolase
MFEAHRKYGKLPWADVVAPAVALARDGHVLDGIRSRNINLELARLARFPASRAQFLLNDAAPPSGTPFVQRDLGATLQLIADSGPKPFYYGSIADLIVQEMQRGGGLITKQDLARYQPKWRVPIHVTYRGYSIYTMPPSGGGVTLAEILNVMEGYPSLPRFGSAALMHLQAETMRRAFVDRNLYLGDPDVVPLPVERLLSKEYAATLRADIDVQRNNTDAR